ncbi:hypothetical protein GCM10027347_31600 [Larkinella harenae]
MATFPAPKTVSVPTFLHKLHGEKTTLPVLTLTYLAALLLAFVTVSDYSAWSWKTALLALLAFDIGGGVVANLSEGTSAYYRTHPNRRWAFVGIHSLQPALLTLVFPAQTGVILLLGFFLLATTGWVNLISTVAWQRVVAGFTTVLMLLLSYILVPEPMIRLLINLLTIKLLLAFAIRWA